MLEETQVSIRNLGLRGMDNPGGGLMNTERVYSVLHSRGTNLPVVIGVSEDISDEDLHKIFLALEALHFDFNFVLTRVQSFNITGFNIFEWYASVIKEEEKKDCSS